MIPATVPAPRAGRSYSGGLWAGVAVVLVALNLRPAIVAVSPFLEVISAELELSSLLAGLLVTIPVLCFGVLGPLAPVLAGRFGFEKSLALMLVLIIAGSALRLLPSIPGLFTGTLLVGAGIALGNILLPGLIKRDFSHRLGLMSGLFSLSITAGATLAAGITLPLAKAAGWEWNRGLAMWGLLGALAFLVWVPALWHSRRARVASAAPSTRLMGDRVAWFVTVFFGLQSFNFYSTTAWLPSILIGFGYDQIFAGLMLSLVTLSSTVPALIVPVLLNRMRDQAPFTVVVSVTYFVGLGGILLAPGMIVPWTVILGAAQGAGLALGLTLIVLRTPDPEHATKLSGMSQSWGYLLAALGPFLLGVLRDVSGGWLLPVVVLGAFLIPQAIAAWLAGRPTMVGTLAPGRVTIE